jgi:hypothetical protein
MGRNEKRERGGKEKRRGEERNQRRECKRVKE